MLLLPLCPLPPPTSLSAASSRDLTSPPAAPITPQLSHPHPPTMNPLSPPSSSPPQARPPSSPSRAPSPSPSPSPSAASVIAFLRHLPHDASPHIFPHLVAALARSTAPLLAHPPLPLSAHCRRPPPHHSFNSALVRFPLPPHLLLAFFAHSLRRFPGLAPTLLSFNLLLKCICSSLAPRYPGLYLAIALRILHDVIPARNLAPDKFTYSTVVSALADAGRVEDAVALVHEMVVDGVVAAEAFNPVLRTMLRAGDVTGAAKLFRFMQLKGCTLTASTYNVLLHGLLLCGKAKAATGVMRRMEREGIEPGLMTYGAVVDGLVKCGRVEDAWKMAEEMGSKGLSPSEFVFSAVISGYCKAGEVDKALRVWEAMATSGITPNIVLYSAMIDGLTQCGRMAEAEMLFGEMVDAKCLPNIMTFSSMIRGYFRSGDPSRALSIWEEMVKEDSKDAMMVWKHMLLARGCAPDTVAYTSMIKGLCISGMVDGGLRLFSDMLAKGDAKPDAITYNVLMDGLIRSKDLARAMDLLNQMLDQRLCLF
ncbi:hypothetical protein PR202_ga17009 [Eleusine coracana subsp. coracana]|uniref:Pentatricopeptide repeat-containing protein n=1 Tax=Eleusine coracana subsp. coracana TaxID=191504 RepID=A0AAV5CPB7_ELECO|nr:hypothetical protein PR202_ga17009 [Eleusine coracana subsp. coracana]